MMTEIGKPERKEILNKLAATVEKRFYDPKFDSAAWRAKVEQQGTPAVDAQSVDEFVSALDRLVRSVGTPDSGLFHESTRKKVPKGIEDWPEAKLASAAAQSAIASNLEKTHES